MGVEAFIAPLIGAVGSYASAKSEAAAAQAQNQETMSFNRKEAEKARKWQEQQNVIDRNYNANQQAIARDWAVKQADIGFNRQKQLQVMAQDYNSREAASARAFDKMMSDTSHQREMVDLAKAGLNPILAAGSGAPIGSIVGASVGAGSAPVASGSGAASHNSSASSMASFSGGHKVNGASMLGSLLHSAVEGVRLDNDIKRAKADVINAEASKTNAETNAKESVQRIQESISRVGLNYDEHELNAIRKMSEEERVKLVREQITSEIVKRQDGHELSQAQKIAVEKSANAYSALCAAQANLSYIRGELETERNPAIIKELNKKADEYESEIKKNEWIMSDPEEINRRNFHKGNESAAGVDFASKVIGNVVHGSISFSKGSHSVTKNR